MGATTVWATRKARAPFHGGCRQPLWLKSCVGLYEWESAWGPGNRGRFLLYMYWVPFRLCQTSRWHQNTSSVLVWGSCTKTELLLWCQREVCHNLIGHPVLLHLAVGAIKAILQKMYRNHMASLNLFNWNSAPLRGLLNLDIYKVCHSAISCSRSCYYTSYGCYGNPLSYEVW